MRYTVFLTKKIQGNLESILEWSSTRGQKKQSNFILQWNVWKVKLSKSRIQQWKWSKRNDLGKVKKMNESSLQKSSMRCEVTEE